MFSIGGAYVYRLAVAPEGSEDWTIEGRKGGTLTDLWGVCSSSDAFTATMFMQWDDDDCYYKADKSAFASFYPTDRHRQFALRELRAHVCATLAGPIASQIHEGEEHIYVDEGEYSRTDDITKAQGMARLLYWRNEYDYLAELTEQTLRRPDVWAMVLCLADELERIGDMDDEQLSGFLPGEVPNWPPSPRAKPIHIEALRIAPLETTAA
ncbi:hypothetical protein CR159_20335 [Pollutimonas subterranea]|uniref:Uncharacterized protein n=2 Tax=Pollutimonas subterranea TaxID=2045210 RepID=A0A2N4TZ42_9BURK|nr:hypothetical protein CR159_20335 [Pollutimonas subterranea]